MEVDTPLNKGNTQILFDNDVLLLFKIFLPPNINNAGFEMTLLLRNNPIVLAVIQMGYNEFIVEYIFKKQIKETGKI